MKKNAFAALVALAALTTACGPEAEVENFEPSAPEPTENIEEANQSIARAPFAMGLATGAIYINSTQSLADPAFRERFICEMRQLGTQYIRMESDWAGVSTAQYRDMVRSLKGAGFKIIMVVAGQKGQQCGGDQAIFRNNYKNHLAWLAANVFNVDGSGDYRPWAYEIGNEPNQTGAAAHCPDGVFRINPDTFAWLLRDVYNWKLSNGRSEMIISGGLLNTYWNVESFWSTFFNSWAFGRHLWNGQWIDYTGRPPYDYFGIHPYNHFNYDQACINAGRTDCWGSASLNSGWQGRVKNDLIGLANKLNQINTVSNTRFFVTEFGWQNVGWADGRIASVKTEAQVTAGMNAAGDALAATGLVSGAIWYNYRNDDEQFGLRGWADPVSVAKWGPWHKFRYMATGINDGLDPHACYR
jgi:hypothetical protein